MLFPRRSHTMEKLLCYLRKLCFPSIKYAIPTLKKKPIAAGASGKCTGRVFRTALKARGSLTVEAALALPVCLGVLLALCGLLQAVMVVEQVNQHLCMTARKAAAFSVSGDGISQAEVIRCYFEGLSDGGLQTKRLRGGAGGVLLSVTQSHESGVFCIRAVYQIKLPGVFGPWRILSAADTVYARAFAGIELPEHGSSGEGHDGQTGNYYVAENGVVYHTDRNCTYLDLSIQQVSASSLSGRRNLSGSKYVPCEKCARSGMPAAVYITNQGEAWHTDLCCSGLKRTIHLQDDEGAHAHGLRPCPRCGGE